MTLSYQLKGRFLETTLALSNVGAEPMPAGFGLHPYFCRHLADSSEGLLSFQTAGMYETDASRIPTVGMKPIPPEFDFAKPREVGAQFIDHGFGGWDGRATLEWPTLKMRLIMEADAIFSHLIVCTARDGSLTVEPVTHATDGFNLRARGVEGTGVQILAPGHTLTGTVRLRFDSAL